MRGKWRKHDVKGTETGSLKTLCKVIFLLLPLILLVQPAERYCLRVECWNSQSVKNLLTTYIYSKTGFINSKSFPYMNLLTVLWKQVLVKALISPTWWFTEKTYDPQTLKFKNQYFKDTFMTIKDYYIAQQRHFCPW